MNLVYNMSRLVSHGGWLKYYKVFLKSGNEIWCMDTDTEYGKVEGLLN